MHEAIRSERFLPIFLLIPQAPARVELPNDVGSNRDDHAREVQRGLAITHPRPGVPRGARPLFRIEKPDPRRPPRCNLLDPLGLGAGTTACYVAALQAALWGRCVTRASPFAVILSARWASVFDMALLLTRASPFAVIVAGPVGLSARRYRGSRGRRANMQGMRGRRGAFPKPNDDENLWKHVFPK
jgi:hypothetical protein